MGCAFCVMWYNSSIKSKEIEMNYRLVNEEYGNSSEIVTAQEVRDLLVDVFGDYDTEIEEHVDGLYESDGTLVAEAL